MWQVEAVHENRTGPGEGHAIPGRAVAYAAVSVDSTPAATTPFASARGQQAQSPEHLTVVWSMIRRIVRAHRPHCALQPRQP